MRAFFDPTQATSRVACAEAFVPFSGPGAPGGGGGGRLSTVISRSSTGAELPAASVTVTTRWCAPLLRWVVSNGTSTLTLGAHGCRYRNAGSPSLVPPTFWQCPPLLSSTVDCTT